MMRRSLFLALLLALPACRTSSKSTPVAASPPPAAVASPPLPAAVEAPRPLARAPRPLLEARANHTAIRLDDGRVFVIGGQSEFMSVVSATTELYDPATGAWTPGPPMAARRYDFAFARLRDGRLLVAGGRGPNLKNHRSAEIFDPKTFSWSPAAPLSSPRSGPMGMLLNDGTALACGGYDSDAVFAVCERYDPARDVWTPAEPMLEPRVGGTFTRLGDGRVLVTGGTQVPGHILSSTELYDPDADAWTRAAPLKAARYGHKALTLPDGRVLVAGGAGPRYPTHGEIFDPKTGAWTPTGEHPQSYLRAFEYLDGKPTLFGGQYELSPLAGVLSYDLARDVWTPLAPLKRARVYASATPLPDGRMLIAGGEAGRDTLRSVELYSPGGEPATSAAAPPAAPALAAERRHPERPNDYAVVIGVEGYRALPTASYADNDAAAMTRALRDLGVPEENTVVLRGSRAGLVEIAKYVEEWLPRRATRSSRVYVFFSGHGAPDVASGEPYLMPWDGDASFVKSTGYPLERLYAALEKLPAGEVVVALDSCFSGSGGRSVLAPGLRPLVNVRMPAKTPRRVSVLAASEASEAAGGLPSARHGAFTYHLLAGLGGAADADADGHLTLAELHAYARKRVILDAREQNREQTPTLTTREPGLRLY